MSISYHQATAVVFERMLVNLSHCIDLGLAFAESKKIDESVLFQARLAPDMYPLSKQIQIATDMAKFCVSRLTGTEAPKFADDETNFAQLKQRIATTIAFMQSVPASAYADAASKEIRLPWMPDTPMTGEFYALHFAVPNVYFHITTAYAILRHNGVNLGKKDFIGAIA